MKALELRKQLLIAESDLNRIHLTAEHVALQTRLYTLTHGITTVGTMASSAAVVATRLAAIPRKTSNAKTKPSWWQTILHGTVFISSVWLALREKSDRA